jgi:hypothetical protein
MIDAQFWYTLIKKLMDPRTSRHPSHDPDFDAKRQHIVWYLSHPLAPDDKFTFQQNMDHVIHLMRICYEEGVMVIAPYHTICLALDDDNPRWRRMGLECDCNMARLMGYVLLTGHKLSSGMNHEAQESMACKSGGIIRNLIGYNDEEFRVALRWIKDGRELEFDEALRT